MPRLTIEMPEGLGCRDTVTTGEPSTEQGAQETDSERTIPATAGGDGETASPKLCRWHRTWAAGLRR